MKKLLIAMTAAAVGTCAWADGDAPTLLNENFDSAPTSWTVEAGKVSAVAAPWSYSGENGAVGDGELTLADGALSLNTGSKVLTGAFKSDGSSKDIGDGLYFKSTVTFKDPSDTLPTLGNSDKFALVVLDNIESVDANKATANTTNLWIIAGHGTKGKCAYQLCPDAETLNLDASWLASAHEIEIKAYADVLDGGAEAAGFLVMIDSEICTVKKAYEIGEDNVIDFSTGTDVNYLGYEPSAILGSLGLRYSKKQLLISAASGNTLASVDFQGQGVIDNVALAETGSDFGADAKTLKITATANGVTDITCGGVAYAEAGYLIPADATSVTVTFKLAANYVLSAPAGAVLENGVYTYTYAVGDDNNQTLAISAYPPAAYVGTTPYETFAAAMTAALSGSGELKLVADVDSAAFGNLTYLYVEPGKTLVLDLNGKTITGVGTAELPTPTIYNEGTLTIKDSSGGTGCVADSGYGAVLNSGSLSIVAGIYNGSVTTDNGTTSITGGKFLKTANTTVAGVAEGYEATDDNAGYWVVDVKPAAPAEPLPDLEIDEDATAEDEKAAVTEALGTQADAAVVANITNAAEYAEFKTWAGTVTGGAAAVVASENAWVAFALDNADLLAGDKVTLADSDITVESFGQAENAAAGQFTLEISLKDVKIGDDATKANLLKIFEAVGTTDLKADFTAGAVTTDVEAADGKAKFTVAPSAATKPNAFFFKAQIKK